MTRRSRPSEEQVAFYLLIIIGVLFGCFAGAAIVLLTHKILGP